MLTFHHIGIACHDIVKTLTFYLGMGYVAAPVIDDPLQHVRVCFLEKPGAPRLELLEPLDDKSPVARTLTTCATRFRTLLRPLESCVISGFSWSVAPFPHVRWRTGGWPFFSRKTQDSLSWLKRGHCNE